MILDAAFLRLHADLPRQGVGADWCTQEAVNRLPPLRKPAAIIDLGCGTGRQTIILAERFKSPIAAVDICPPFLDQLMEAATAAGVAQWITPRCEDFSHLGDAPGGYDLVWCEGAAWVLGWKTALALWAPLLRARGVMAISDCTWLSASRAPEARAYWGKIYPSMSDIAGNMAHAKAAGLKVFDHFILPRSSWWDAYYAPLSRRIAKLDAEAASDPALAEAIAETKAEIEMFERFGDGFGYVFYLLRQR